MKTGEANGFHPRTGHEDTEGSTGIVILFL